MSHVALLGKSTAKSTSRGDTPERRVPGHSHRRASRLVSWGRNDTEEKA